MMNEKIDIPVWEKYTLTIEEASRYFTIGPVSYTHLTLPTNREV